MSKRSFVVLGAVLIQLSLGAVYGWSLFNQPLTEKFGWAKEDILVTFSITIATFALFTIFAGKAQDKVGPRLVATAGGILLATGLFLASRADTLFQLYLFYGIIGGAGIGTAYVAPLAASVKWFPEKRGLISGIAVAGFGGGGLIFKPIILALIERFGVSETFFYLGIIYLILVVGGAQLLFDPPKSLIYQQDGIHSKNNDFSPKEMFATSQFYLMWFMFLFGTISGLLVIGQAVDIGITLANLSTTSAANAVVFIAFFNAAGRIFWGMISDKIGRKNALKLMYLLTSLTMLYLAIGNLNYPLFIVAVSIVGFAFGGFLAVFPSKTADYFGLENIGVNYGIMYQAYGISAFIGPVIANFVPLKQAFIITAILSLFAIGMTFLLKLPVKSPHYSK